jgi:uncharacterized repeat protein (TIGR03847 family)
MTADLGTARAVDAQTFGEPGERTFRLRVIGADQSASLWMEKQQFQALNLAFAQMLAQLNYEEKTPLPELSDFPGAAQHDFRVGRIGLGYDTSNKTFVLDAYEIGLQEEETEAEATVRVRLTPDHCASLVGQLSEIVAQGRPLCPLCGASMDAGGHVCIRTNGHSNQPIPDEQGGEEEEGPGG